MPPLGHHEESKMTGEHEHICGDCKFYDWQEERMGYCRIKAPSVSNRLDRELIVLMGSMVKIIGYHLEQEKEAKMATSWFDDFGDGWCEWPTVLHDDWCGEFKPK